MIFAKLDMGKISTLSCHALEKKIKSKVKESKRPVYLRFLIRQIRQNIAKNVSVFSLVFRKQVHRLKFYNRYRGDDVLRRNYKQIDQLERDQLAIHRSKGLSFSVIGELLGRGSCWNYESY